MPIKGEWPKNLIEDVLGEEVYCDLTEDRIAGVEKALNSDLISQTAREIILLRYKEGMSLKRISETVGVSTYRVSQLLDNTMWKLKNTQIGSRRFVGGRNYIQYGLREGELRNKVEGLDYAIDKLKKKVEETRRLLQSYEAPLNNLLEERAIVFSEIGHASDELSTTTLNMKIEELNPGVRALNCLHRGGFKTIGDIVNECIDAYKTEGLTPVQRLMKITYLGQRTAYDILNTLSEHGINLNKVVKEDNNES